MLMTRAAAGIIDLAAYRRELSELAAHSAHADDRLYVILYSVGYRQLRANDPRVA